MKKIVIFMDNPQIPTGYASTCRLTAEQLKARGYDVYAVSFNGGSQMDTVYEWGGMKIVPNYALSRDGSKNYGDADTVRKIVEEIKPDILFFHNDSYRYSYLKELPQEIMDKAVFWLPFEGDHVDQLGVEIFKKCAATRFVTKKALGIHEGILAGNDVGDIPHAVNTAVYTPVADKEAAKAAHGKPLPGKFVVSRVDRHQPRKYWNLTLEAFARFAKGKQDVCLLAKCNPRDITMWDDNKKTGIDLHALAQQLGISDKVFFDDYFFSQPFMAKSFYNPADVMLTTTSGEGFGLTVAEAMACGVPVIYPDTPVLPEVVSTGGVKCRIERRDFHAPMNVHHNIVDVADVAAKLEWAYQDWKNNGSQELKKIGAAGRKIAEENYSPKSVYDKWDEVFTSVCEKRVLCSIVTVMHNFVQDQLDGEYGIQLFKDTLEKYVKHPYEWVIVDNGSPYSEKTRAWLEKAASENKRIKPVFLDDNMGFAGGCNAGIAKARGKHVILANPDCQALNPATHGMPKDFVGMMVDKAESDPNIGIVGMHLYRRDDILTASLFPYFCNVLLTRPCLDAAKLAEGKWFDESFWPAYYEDADLCFRIMSKGLKAVAINCPFYHVSGGANRHAIDGGKDGACVKHFLASIDRLEKLFPDMAPWKEKRQQASDHGMQGMIKGNIDRLNMKWGPEARRNVKVVFETHIGAGVGFSLIVEGLAPELHRLGFDVYINDWSNKSNMVADPVIRELCDKYVTANKDGTLEGAIHIVCWLMETYQQVEADYKVGVSFCESTKVRPSYLNLCNSMDRILTFSDFCKGVQKDSGFTSPISVLPPGVHQDYVKYFDRPERKKFTFLSVGVAQERKDTYRMVHAFAEAFPKGHDHPPEREENFGTHCDDVQLVLKSNNFGDLEWIKRDGLDKRANIVTIFTGWDQRAERKDFSNKEMYDLYCSADCLIHPSHGEGIGMPLCFTEGTLIRTPNGAIPIECQKTGDLVYTHKGRLRPVKNVMRRNFDGQLITIKTLMNNKTMECTPEHPILVVRSRYKHANDSRYATASQEWVMAKDVRKGDLMVVPSRSMDSVKKLTVLDLAEFLHSATIMHDDDHVWSKYSNRPNGVTASMLSITSGVSKRQTYRVMENEGGVAVETKQRVLDAMNDLGYEESSYIKCPRHLVLNYDAGLLVGYYASEGSLAKGNVSFAFHENEKHFHSEVRRLMKSVFGIKEAYERKNNSNGYEMIFSCSIAAGFFKAFCGTGSREKKIDGKLIPVLPDEFKKGFISGFWNGDGSDRFDKTGHVSIATSSDNLAHQIWGILLEFGKHASLKQGVRNRDGVKVTENTIEYSIFEDVDDLTGAHGAKTTRTRSHYHKSIKGDGFFLAQILKVGCKEAKCSVYNIEVEEDNSYCVNGFAVHNCEAAGTGLPAIFTNWSSPAEYFDESNSYPCSLSPYEGTTFSDAYPGAGPAGENGKWANIWIGHMKHLMYQVVKDRAESKAKGLAAAKHIQEKHTWSESCRHLAPMLFEWDRERRNKASRDVFDPMTFEKPPLTPISKGDRVLVDIVTRDRHGYLCSLLTSLLHQTFKEWDVVIQCDDKDDSMPSQHQIRTLMNRFSHEGHGWQIIRSHRQGPHMAHDRSLNMAAGRYKLVCRVDDDIFLRPDYLEKLFEVFATDKDSLVGAVGGVYPDPSRSDAEQMAPKGFETDREYAGKIDHNVPWPYICHYPPGTPPREVEHLYSSFMYRVEVAKAVGGYCKQFSQIGHREESDFSYRFFLAGYKLFIQPAAVGYHYCAPGGGIRSDSINDRRQNAENDHKVYSRRIEKWKKRAAQRKMIESAQPRPRKSDKKDDGGDDDGGGPPSPHGGIRASTVVVVNVSAGDPTPADLAHASRFGSRVVTYKDAIDKIAIEEDARDDGLAFSLTLWPGMRFVDDPLQFLGNEYDLYSFDVHESYVPGARRPNPDGEMEFVFNPAMGSMIGPECSRLALGRKLFAQGQRQLDTRAIVIRTSKTTPLGGQSIHGNELLPLKERRHRIWTRYVRNEGNDLPDFSEEPVVPTIDALVSIIIPTAGRLQLLRNCVESIYTYTSTPFEIIIVDNGSDDGTLEYCQEQQAGRRNFKLVRNNENVGYQKAINQGVGASRGGYILLFNDDAWVTGLNDGKDWLRVYCEMLDEDPRIGLVGPHPGKSPALGIDMLFFWCVMTRRSTWERVGPLDESFVNYGGDDDYCRRLADMGFCVRDRYTSLRHLMTCVPDHVKQPKLKESREKLLAKYGGVRGPEPEQAKPATPPPPRRKRILAYALGQGMGHVSRCLSLGRLTARNGASFTLLTESPVAREQFLGASSPLSAKEVEGCNVRFVTEPEMRNGSRILEMIGDHDLLLVDNHPGGLFGELAKSLPGIGIPKVLVHQYLTSSYMDDPDVVGSIPFYDLVITCGEASPKLSHKNIARTAPWLSRDWHEVLPRGAAREILKAKHGRVIAVLASGLVEESAEMARMASILSGLLPSDDVRLVSALDVDWQGVPVARHWPFLELHGGVDLIVGQGGYNTVYECRATGAALVAIPRVRRFEDQLGRLREDEVIQPQDFVARIMSRLSAMPATPPPIKKFENGTHKALEAILSLMQ